MSSYIKLKKYLTISIIILLSFMYLPVYATNDAMFDLLKIMVDKGSLTQGEYEILVSAAMVDGNKVDANLKKVKAKVEEKTKYLPKVTSKGKFKIESQDGDHYFQPIGRIFWDTVWVDDDGNPDEHSGSELRRARLGVSAQFFKNWQAKLEYDFAGSDADLKDGWISYNNKFTGGQSYNIKVGQHHVPFGFNTISSSKYMSFLRRPLFADGPLSPARNYGVAFRVDDKRWLLHAGAFLEGPSDGEVNVDDDGEDETTLAIRFAGTPVMKDENHLLQLGASYMYKEPHGDSLKREQRIVSHLSDDKVFGINFGSNADDVNAFDLEALSVWGPFHALAEYVHWNISDPDGDADISAWSVEAGWFLTGESMKYKAGQFSGISPKRPFIKGSGLGAWQLAARFENMDLNDGGYTGGDGDVMTVGLNWYPIKNVRFMANYAKTLDFSRTGDAADGIEPAAFSIRSQVYW